MVLVLSFNIHCMHTRHTSSGKVHSKIVPRLDGGNNLPFELVYTDLARSFKPQAKDGSRYISKFTDHHTRWKAVYPIATKDKALHTLIYFH